MLAAPYCNAISVLVDVSFCECCLTLLTLLHHVAHVELGVAGGNLEQACGLRSFFNVLQFAAAILAVPLHWETQFGIEPHGAGFALGIGSFILDGAAAVDSFAADFVARAALIVFEL